mgnify:FL=1
MERFNFNAPCIFTDEAISLIGGWTGTPVSWREYRKALPRKHRKVFDKFRKVVLNDPTLFKKGAMNVNYERGNLSFEVSVRRFLKKKMVRLSFTFRAWGDLMSAVADEREGYLAYY